MKKNIKKIVISLLIIGIVATLAIGFAGCEKNLDGLYLDDRSGYSAVKITGNTIHFVSREEIDKGEFNIIDLETTFTRDKDKLVLAKKFYELKELMVTKNGNLTGIGKAVISGEDVPVNYIKQK